MNAALSMIRRLRRSLARFALRRVLPEHEKAFFLELFDEFRRARAFDSYEEKMIEGVFGLSETTVADVMTPKINIDVLEHDDDWDTVFDKIAKTNHSRYPVVNSDRDEVVGTLISKDLLAGKREDLLKRRITDFVRDPYYAPEKTRLNSMLLNFTTSRRHMALVADEFGSFLGLITLEDVLEEIVGEIEDEHDEREDRLIVPIRDNNTYKVNPMIPISDLCDELEIDLQGNGADTLGGFLVRHFGRLPRRGDTLTEEKFEIHVSKVSTRRVTEVRIVVKGK